MTNFPYFTKETLIAANKVAISTKRNRTLHEHMLDKLDPELKFPVGFNMIHNDCEIRCMIVLGVDPNIERVWLDVPIETFNDLPRHEMGDLRTEP